MKKVLLTVCSLALSVMFIVNVYAAVVTRRSVYGYVGSATYWAEAEFAGTALISGSSTMRCNGGTVSGITSSEGAGQVTVRATLSAPSNYGVSINRTVYNTSTIVN